MLEKGNRANTLHGILLIALFSFAAFYIAEIPVVRRLSFSPLIVGIVLGMLYANSLRNRLPETWVPGIRFCTKQVLRWGIVLYGFRLTLAQVAAVGVPAVVVDLIVVTVTILGGVLLGRLLKIDRDTALMTSTGSAICGAAAVLGAEPVVKCEGYKTAIAVSTVVIFGTLSMFLYPVMYRTGMLNGMTDTEVAVYTGSTLHEVAHVAGAGNAMDPTDALGSRRNGHHHQDDPRHAARARARDHGLRAGGPPEGIRGRNGKTQDRRAVVRARVSGGDRLQFVRPVRGGDRVVHPFAGHFSADDGHDRSGSRDQYRKVQKGGRQAFRALVASVRVACGGRLAAGQIHGSRIDVGASDSRVSRA